MQGLGWVAYSVVTQNMFVLVSNAPGLILSIWLNMGAAKLQYQEMYRSRYHGDNSLFLRNEEEEDSNEFSEDANSSGSHTYIPVPSCTSHEHWVIGIITIWMIVLTVACFGPLSDVERANLIGIVVNVNLVVFYGAPLSTIKNVLRSRNSVSIHRKTLATGFLNSFFWLAYGIALMDMVILVPNASGFLLSVIQIILCIAFPRSDIEYRVEHGVEEQLVNDANESQDEGSTSGDSHVEML